MDAICYNKIMNKKLALSFIALLLMEGSLSTHAQTGNTDQKIAAQSVPSVFQIFAVVDATLTYNDFQIDHRNLAPYTSYPSLSSNIESLVGDIQNDLSQGKSLAAARTNAIGLGWTPQDIDTAIRVAQHPDQYAKQRTFSDEYISQSGTAFAVSEDGYLVSNAHVVTVDKDQATQDVINDYLAATSTTDMFSALGVDPTSNDGDTLSNNIGDYLSQKENATLTFKVTYKILPPSVVSVPDQSDVIQQGWDAKLVYSGDPYPGKDVALLKLDLGHPLPVLTLADAEPQVGTRVYVIGYPGAANLTDNFENQATFTSGAVNAVRSSDGGDFTVFQTDASIGAGSSGGPVLDPNGNVEGILTLGTSGDRGKSGNFNFFLPDSLIRELFKNANVTITGAGSATAAYRRGVASLESGDCGGAEHNLAAVQDFLKSDFIHQLAAECVPGAAPATPTFLEISAVVVVLGAFGWQQYRRRKAKGPGQIPPAPPAQPSPTQQPLQ